MLKAHEHTLCKCGRNLIDGKCVGCSLIYDICVCESLENIDDFVPKREINEEPLLR